MRRQAQEEVAEAARRRLELLRLELERSGLYSDDPEPPAAPPVASPSEVVGPEVGGPGAGPEAAQPVAPAGRHARAADSAYRRWAGWLEDRLPATLRGRVGLGGRELVVLAVVLAVGLGIAGVVVLRSGSAGVALPAAVKTRPSPGSGRPSALVTPSAQRSDASVPAADPSDSERVVVDVAGKVRHPGVVRLPAGSRVIDALRKAGGALPKVDLTSLNLAQVLTDGQQILVGVAAAPGIAASAAATPGAPAPGSGPMVDINTATTEQLEALPGVGPVTARKIVTWRSANGSFTSVDELLEIDGIGEKTLADLAPYVTL